jgi:hypothetical protein
MRLAMFVAAALAAVSLCGCGDVPRGRIHGKVLYQGKPLTGATVVFMASDNRTHPVRLKADGTFEVAGVALGPVKVSFQQDLPSVAAKSQYDVPLSSEAKGVTDEKASRTRSATANVKGPPGLQLPAQYADAEKSGLTFELNQPDQEWSADLK